MTCCLNLPRYVCSLGVPNVLLRVHVRDVEERGPVVGEDWCRVDTGQWQRVRRFPGMGVL